MLFGSSDGGFLQVQLELPPGSLNYRHGHRQAVSPMI